MVERQSARGPCLQSRFTPIRDRLSLLSRTSGHEAWPPRRLLWLAAEFGPARNPGRERDLVPFRMAWWPHEGLEFQGQRTRKAHQPVAAFGIGVVVGCED